MLEERQQNNNEAISYDKLVVNNQVWWCNQLDHVYW